MLYTFLWKSFSYINGFFCYVRGVHWALAVFLLIFTIGQHQLASTVFHFPSSNALITAPYNRYVMTREWRDWAEEKRKMSVIVYLSVSAVASFPLFLSSICVRSVSKKISESQRKRILSANFFITIIFFCILNVHLNLAAKKKSEKNGKRKIATEKIFVDLMYLYVCMCIVILYVVFVYISFFCFERTTKNSCRKDLNI